MSKNKSREKTIVGEEKRVDQKEEESNEPEKWEKPVMAESDVFLYCMGEG